MRIFQLGKPNYKKARAASLQPALPNQLSRSKFKNRYSYTASRTLLNM